MEGRLPVDLDDSMIDMTIDLLDFITDLMLVSLLMRMQFTQNKQLNTT
jgi:hypothetical protein